MIRELGREGWVSLLNSQAAVGEKMQSDDPVWKTLCIVVAVVD